jgi:hypothetical protein
MPLSLVLIVVWVVGIPAYFAYVSVTARRLVRSAFSRLKLNRIRQAGRIMDAHPARAVQEHGTDARSSADLKSRDLALIQTSCGYVFQRYRLRWAWWEAVRPPLCASSSLPSRCVRMRCDFSALLLSVFWCR